MNKRIVVIMLLVTLALAFSSCGSATEPTATDIPTATAAPEGAETTPAPATSAPATLTPTGSATQAPATASPETTAKPFTNSAEINLAKKFYGTGTYMEGEGIIVDSGVELIAFKLPVRMEENQTVSIRIRGTSSDNFRSWLLDSQQSTVSEIVNFTDSFDYLDGEFDFTYELTASERAIYLAFKAPSYGATFDEFVIYSITVEYPEDVELP